MVEADYHVEEECVICQEREPQILLRPCLHLCVCGPCSKRLKKQQGCPLCRSQIDEKEKIEATPEMKVVFSRGKTRRDKIANLQEHLQQIMGKVPGWSCKLKGTGGIFGHQKTSARHALRQVLVGHEWNVDLALVEMLLDAEWSFVTQQLQSGDLRTRKLSDKDFYKPSNGNVFATVTGLQHSIGETIASALEKPDEVEPRDLQDIVKNRWNYMQSLQKIAEGAESALVIKVADYHKLQLKTIIEHQVAILKKQQIEDGSRSESPKTTSQASESSHPSKQEVQEQQLEA